MAGPVSNRKNWARDTRVDGLITVATHYFDVGGASSLVHAIQLRYGTVQFTATVRSSNIDRSDDLAPVNAVGGANAWVTEAAVVVAAGTGTAGGQMLHVGNLGALRLQLVVVVSAQGDGLFDVIACGKE